MKVRATDATVQVPRPEPPRTSPPSTLRAAPWNLTLADQYRRVRLSSCPASRFWTRFMAAAFLRFRFKVGFS